MSSHQNPRDSMKSTWRENRSKWRAPHHLLNIVGLHPTNANQAIPVFSKSAPVPYISELSCHVWVLAHALWPIALQYAYVAYSGKIMHPAAVFVLYAAAFKSNAIHQIHVLRRLGHRYGFLDGDRHTRDQVPDVGVAKALHSLLLTTSVRPLVSILLSPHPGGVPRVSWWLPVEIGLYAIVLDFWFYLYHRACHEVEGFWKYHRTHHLTKHPNPVLSAYADTEQEIMEIGIVPILACITLRLCGLPMGFHEWWICHEYIIFTESFGHSGLRLFKSPPSTFSPLLKYFHCDLIIEDHDLHHRKGWRKSYNYGKQTRVWDRLFGTCHERIECTEGNIDWSHCVTMPLL